MPKTSRREMERAVQDLRGLNNELGSRSASILAELWQRATVAELKSELINNRIGQEEERTFFMIEKMLDTMKQGFDGLIGTEQTEARKAGFKLASATITQVLNRVGDLKKMAQKRRGPKPPPEPAVPR